MPEKILFQGKNASGGPQSVYVELTADGRLPVSTGVTTYADTLTPILTNVTTVSTGAAVAFGKAEAVIMAKLSGTGTFTATVELWGNTANSNTSGKKLVEFTLSNTTLSEGLAVNAKWPYLYGKVTAITGSPTVNMEYY